jgi:hypothetical protein
VLSSKTHLQFALLGLEILISRTSVYLQPNNCRGLMRVKEMETSIKKVGCVSNSGQHQTNVRELLGDLSPIIVDEYPR